MLFLNCRVARVGGDVGPVQLTDGTLTYPDLSGLVAQVRGRHLLLALHGFNVDFAGAVNHFQTWDEMLQLDDSSLFLGGLWPGDSAWLGALEYAFAARAAMQSGIALAGFLNQWCTGAMSLSLVSHSLGARVALNLISHLDASFDVRRLMLMAPAVDDTCLTGEFSAAAGRVGQISILSSSRDEVLKLAFPLGNPVSGLFASGHPYWHAALGREGPASLPQPNNIHAGWQLPDSWDVNHSDYLPPLSPYPQGYVATPFTGPVDMPAPGSASPATGTPASFDLSGKWQNWTSSWTAALTSSRFR